MSPSANWMVALIALSVTPSSIGMSEEGYDSDVYEFNRANHLDHPAGNTKRAFYFKPYQKKPHPIGSRPEEHKEYEPRPAQYKYRWKVEDDYSGNYFGHAESRDDTNTIGEYYVMLPDGRVQRVRYTVEGPYGGFKAVVSYEGKTKIAKPEKPRPPRPKNIFPAIRIRKPTYERAALRAVDPAPTYALSTPGPGPSPESTLTPQFSNPRPTVVQFERKSEPKWKRYSYRTLPDEIPDDGPIERASPGPSSALPPTVEDGPVANEEKTAVDSQALKTAAPPPTPYNFSYGPPGFQDPPPSRTSSHFDQDPPLNAVRRFTYRPVDEEVEEIEEEEEEEEDAVSYYDDDHEGTNDIQVDDYREVLEPVVGGVPSTSSPNLHPRDPEVATLHYSLSSPYPPLHHSYVLQDHLYPLPSVKRYSYKELPDEDGYEEGADAIADAEGDGADVPGEILDEGDGAESRDKVGSTGDGAESDEEQTRVSRREERKEMNNDNIQMTIPEDLVLPESEVWGYRYLP